MTTRGRCGSCRRLFTSAERRQAERWFHKPVHHTAQSEWRNFEGIERTPALAVIFPPMVELFLYCQLRYSLI